MARPIPVDETAVRELELYADNDQAIYHRRLEFEKAAARKMCSGKYDKTKAPKLWEYFTKETADKYRKEFGAPDSRTFSPADRRQVAENLARDFEARARAPGRPDIAPEVAEILEKKTCKR